MAYGYSPGAVILLLALASGAPAADVGPVGPSQNGWVTTDGSPAPIETQRASSGAFCAELLVVTDPRFLQDWQRETKVFKYSSAAAVPKGRPFIAIVMFANAGAGAEGRARLKVDYVIRKPNGEVYGELLDRNGGNGAAPKENILELAIDYLMVRIEPADPLGVYTLEATLRDEVSGKTLRLSRSLAVVDR